jgi:hypothetical protein
VRLHRSAVIWLGLLLALGTAGCAAEQAGAGDGPATSESATPSPTPTPTPSGEATGGSYATLEELRTTLVSAGANCPSFVSEAEVPAARESGFCVDSGWGLSIYDSADARNEVLQLNVDSLEPGTFLAGPDWLIARADLGEDNPEPTLEELQPVLGGVVWTHIDPFPSA